MERTLSIVKPDGVQKNLIGEVIKRFEARPEGHWSEDDLHG